MLKYSIEEVNEPKTEIFQLKSENEEKERKIQSEELSTNPIHGKIHKVKEHMKNYKIDSKIKDDTIDEPAMEHKMSNDLTNLKELKIKQGTSDKTRWGRPR